MSGEIPPFRTMPLCGAQERIYLYIVLVVSSDWIRPRSFSGSSSPELIPEFCIFLTAVKMLPFELVCVALRVQHKVFAAVVFWKGTFVYRSIRALLIIACIGLTNFIHIFMTAPTLKMEAIYSIESQKLYTFISRRHQNTRTIKTCSPVRNVYSSSQPLTPLWYGFLMQPRFNMLHIRSGFYD
jgi:hypothetical protein